MNETDERVDRSGLFISISFNPVSTTISAARLLYDL